MQPLGLPVMHAEDTQAERPSTHKAFGEQCKGVSQIALAKEEVICMNGAHI